MKQYFFSTQKMTVGYNSIPIINNINITLEKGEILTLIGPNGSGKSTILKSIIGQLSLISGTVFLEKKALNNMSEKEISKKLSIVLTEHVHSEMITCEDVVAMGRYPYTGRLGILSDKDKKIVNETMELTAVTDLADKEFSTCSDGQKQRIMLARAIAQEPEILVLDEPTSYLDIKYKLEFLSLLQKLAKKKKLTVIMSLHELDLAERISDKILCIKEGCVERIGTPDMIFQTGYINSLYQITEGSFDECFCTTELQKITGTPEIFVISGGGTGIPIYRKLQKNGIPFSTGILWENDLDMPVAKALAVNVIKETAFQKIKNETVTEAKREINNCKKVICTIEEFGELNQENKYLLMYAEERGYKISIM